MIHVNLPAGIELDALIADMYYDWPRHAWTALSENTDYCQLCHTTKNAQIKFSHEVETYCLPGTIPHFSTDMATAWKLVEKIKGIFPNYDFCLENYGETNYFWFRINDTSQGGWNSDGAWDKRVADATAETAPLAICRVAYLLRKENNG